MVIHHLVREQIRVNMPRKKKAASNRGFATVSTPKSNTVQPTPPPPPPPPSDNVNVQPLQTEIPKTPSPPSTTKKDDTDDNVTRLAKRFAHINDRKAETLLNELGSRGASEEQGTAGMRSFALTADVEFDLLQVLKHQGKADTFGKGTITCLDIC